MATKNYRNTLKALEAELAALLQDKQKIDARIVKLRETIIAFNRLIAEDKETPTATRIAESGLTESVREAMKEMRSSNPPKFFKPTEIRDRLAEKGFSFAGYKNEMAAIHNVLKRLKNLGEVEIGVDTEGRVYYRWVEQITNYVRQVREDLDKKRTEIREKRE